MDPLPTRRKLAPTSSAPISTAEEQAQRHGIPTEISNALQSAVGSRVRQAIAGGRARTSTFGRTQSHPASFFSPSTFQTNDETYQHAQSVIHKDEMRRQARELQPYGSGGSNGVDALDLRGSGAAEFERGNRRLKFSDDGEVEMEVDGMRKRIEKKREDWGLSQGKKRNAHPEEEGDISDTATEVDEEEERTPILDPSGSGSTIDEFPAVFTSPAISHPALFRGNGAALPAVPQPKSGLGRQMRGLPGRALGKTMSAPVIMGGMGGMEVDEPSSSRNGLVGDGFDVGEWAEDVNF